MAGRPLPVPDEASAPYWANCAKHILTLPRCARCETFTFPLEIICPNCHSLDPAFQFEPVSGRGKIRTWTVMRHSYLAGFEIPFILVDIEFTDQPGVRMIGRLLDGPDTPLQIGDPVEIAFEDIALGVSIPAFRKAAI